MGMITAPACSFMLADHRIGDDAPCFIVAEVGLAHDGSLGTAHAFIDVAARAGVDAIKFQTHIADAESSPDEPFRVPFSRQDDSRMAYWARTAFDAGAWRGLAEHARDSRLIFLSSPFSLAAVDLLESIDGPAWKIASGEVSNLLLLDRIARTGRPVILSSGLSDDDELARSINRLRDADVDVALLRCTTAYPSPPEQIGLDLLPRWRERFDVPVGLSDHSGVVWHGVIAAANGAAIVEVHVTLSRDAFGPDVPASLTPEELTQLVQGIRFAERMRTPAATRGRGDIEAMRAIFCPGLVTARPLGAGHVLTHDDLSTAKPLRGLAAGDFERALGRALRRALDAREPIREEDLR